MSPAELAPFLIIIAGPNGSGKSTLTRQLVSSGVDFGEYINPDEIAATLEGDYDARVHAAQKIADARRATAISERRSFSFETVMSHPSKLDVLRMAKAVGFQVVMYFVATDNPLLNVKRVADRVAKGGHNVPADKIVARYRRTLSLLPDAIHSCDQAVIFDNSRLSILPWLRLERDETGAMLTLRQSFRSVSLPAWIPVSRIRDDLDRRMNPTETQTTTRWQSNAA